MQLKTHAYNFTMCCMLNYLFSLTLPFFLPSLVKLCYLWNVYRNRIKHIPLLSYRLNLKQVSIFLM